MKGLSCEQRDFIPSQRSSYQEKEMDALLFSLSSLVLISCNDTHHICACFVSVVPHRVCALCCADVHQMLPSYVNLFLTFCL